MNILNKLTKNYLKMNKKRTLVTIIGIILTGAMISGVTTLASSFQRFMINTEKEMSGPWEATFCNVEYANSKYIKDNEKTEESFFVEKQGVALLGDNKEDFIEIRGYENKSLDYYRIKALEGRLPQSENEITLTQLFFSINPEYKIGDTIKLNVGMRLYEGVERPAKYPYVDGETFETKEVKEYKIVGKISTPSFASGGYLSGAITYLDTKNIEKDSIVNVGVITKNNKNIYEDTKNIAVNANLYEDEEDALSNINYNKSLLMFYGVNNESGFTSTIIGVCAVLIIVIAIGAILVIYNGFAISVSERKKQFGILSSIGATKSQIKKMVIFEGVIVGAIAIPLGILVGIAGIGITLNVVNGLLKPMMSEMITTGMTTNLELVISYPSLIVAVILIAITIYLSVVLPARRASKISPIDAIRQTDDVKVKPRKLKTPKFLRKIYGIEGDIALKNLKRSKKRYRTTVISLVISIVLFITFNGFVTYMFTGFDGMYMTTEYDYMVQLSANRETNNSEDNNNYEHLINNAIKDINSIEGIDKSVTIKSIECYTNIAKDNINNSLKKLMDKNERVKEVYEFENDLCEIGVNIISLDNTEYANYLKQVGINSIDDGKCILVNYINDLYSTRAQYEITNYKKGDKIKLNKYTKNAIGVENVTSTLEIAKVSDKLPYGVMSFSGRIVLVVNENTMNTIKNTVDEDVSTEVLIETADSKAFDKRAEDALQKYKGKLWCYRQDIASDILVYRNLKLIISIFLYGFIALISAIGISNIFNTISTNINLRRREFANLKSIGMTDKAFRKMLNLECVFYGTKALLYGLPIGALLCYVLKNAFSSDLISYMYKLPISSMLISAIAVYTVVYITMIYSSRKVKKENIIDVLRDDNI